MRTSRLGYKAVLAKIASDLLDILFCDEIRRQLREVLVQLILPYFESVCYIKFIYILYVCVYVCIV